jgi:hypothetical protein
MTTTRRTAARAARNRAAWARYVPPGPPRPLTRLFSNVVYFLFFTAVAAFFIFLIAAAVDSWNNR